MCMCIAGASEAVPRQAVSHDVSKEHRTVFVSNLLYSVDEDGLREIFSQVSSFGESCGKNYCNWSEHVAELRN